MGFEDIPLKAALPACAAAVLSLRTAAHRRSEVSRIFAESPRVELVASSWALRAGRGAWGEVCFVFCKCSRRRPDANL